MMGCDTQGWTMIENPNVWEVLATIQEALESLPVADGHKKPFVRWETTMPASHYMIANFEFNGERRMLWVFFRHHGDAEPAGPKVIYNLGMWGSSKLIVRTVCNAMLKYGRTFFQLNDCGDDGVEVTARETA